MTDVKTKYREPWFLSNDNDDETWCITDGVETFPIADASQAEFGLAVNGTIERAAQPRQIDRDNIQTAVFEALGAVSVCWSGYPSLGEFDSTRARQIGDELMAKLSPFLSPIPATGEVEWEYGVFDAEGEWWGGSNSLTAAQHYLAQEPGGRIMRRGPWEKVTP